jgi:hypothetical protein
MQGLILKSSYRPQTINGHDYYSIFNKVELASDGSYEEVAGDQLCNHKAQKTE